MFAPSRATFIGPLPTILPLFSAPAALPISTWPAEYDVDPVPPCALSTMPLTADADPVTSPTRLAVMVPAEKSPCAFLTTTLLGVLRLVASTDQV